MKEPRIKRMLGRQDETRHKANCARPDIDGWQAWRSRNGSHGATMVGQIGEGRTIERMLAAYSDREEILQAIPKPSGPAKKTVS